MPLTGFEPAIPEIVRPHICTLDRIATGIGESSALLDYAVYGFHFSSVVGEISSNSIKASVFIVDRYDT
jgi:hypothetical protein